MPAANQSPSLLAILRQAQNDFVGLSWGAYLAALALWAGLEGFQPAAKWQRGVEKRISLPLASRTDWRDFLLRAKWQKVYSKWQKVLFAKKELQPG